MRRRAHGDTGSAVTEAVLLIPMLVVVLLFVVFVGRVTSADQDVEAAARDGARAASRAGTTDAAVDDARQTVAATLGRDRIDCVQLVVDVDTTGFTRDGLVTVTVHCQVALGDLTGLRVPGSKTLTARSVEVVDRFRGGLP